MLGRLRMSIKDCLSQYQTVGKKVFGSNASTVTKVTKGIFGSAYYDIEELQRQIKVLLREKEIDETEAFLEAPDPSCKV
ncbi:hypothetical protein TWF694_005671 [Orbilia ellipsospora]|uniref:Uncharacterized protein n=1 Tax=Orbilia ellipsospora TaxID=2528407 RepID=A0AAV9WRP8_9PEZI